MISSDGIRNLNDYFTKAEEMYGTCPFLKYTEKGNELSRTYTEFMTRVRKFAHFIREYSISAGRKINAALIGHTGYDYLTVMIGTVYAGSAIVPLDSQMNAETLADHLQRSGAEIIFYEKDLSGTVKAALESCPEVKLSFPVSDADKPLDSLISEHPAEYFTDISPDECAFIIYTSGTTGKSKGVMLSHRNMLSTILTVKPNPELEKGSVCAFLPPHHVFSVNCDYLYAFRFGMAVCICDDLSHFTDDIKKYQPATIHIVPMMVKAIYRALVSAKEEYPELGVSEIKELVLGKKFSRILSGGGGLPDDLRVGILNFGLRIASGYGMSECSPSITEAPFDAPSDKKGTVGMPLSSCRVRIADDGEVLVKGDNVMIGYYGSPEQTAEVLSEDGWLKTGDIGHLDNDGFLYLTGRKKNLIILSNGENVSPEEIEKRFADCRAVAEIIVFGNNDSLAAEIYPDPSAVAENGREKTEETVRKAVSEINRDLPSYKRIAEVIFRDKPFERTSSKKIIRSKAGTGISSAQSGTAQKKQCASDLEKLTAEIIAKASGRKDFGTDETFASIGLDSFGCVSAITDIYEKLGCSIDLAALMENDTVEKLAAYIKSSEKTYTDHSVRNEYPLSNLMKYFIYVINGNTVGNVPSAIELPLNTDTERLKNAVSAAIDAHPVLKGTVDMKRAVILRNDKSENHIDIIKTTESEWKKIKEHLVAPFTYKPGEKLYHIGIYKTEKAVYLRLDLSHAVTDGVSLGMFIREISRAYSGEKLTKETNSFYEYLLDEKARADNGVPDKDSEKFAEIYNGIKIGGSNMTIDHGMDIDTVIPATIKQRLYRINREKVMNFCAEHCTSENILFLTAFNICISLFSGNESIFTTSIHSGRTDGRYADSIGMYFRQYACRYDSGKCRTTDELLEDTASQVRDVMKLHTSCSSNGEYLFQFQGDIFNVDRIGDLQCKRVDISIDSHPFRIMIMNRARSYMLHLSYHANRFDTSTVYVLIDCYQHVVNALLENKTIPEIISGLPEEICAGRLMLSSEEINAESGRALIPESSENTGVWILDEHTLDLKPFGAWGTLFIADRKPASYTSALKNPHAAGILYNTGIKARIMPDNSLNVFGPESRVVRVENHKGGYYYDLNEVEKEAMKCKGVTAARAYLEYSKEYRVYVLRLDVETDSSMNKEDVVSYFNDNVPENLRPVKIADKKPKIRHNQLKRKNITAGF
ncbi:AMP-binding protein [Ruminococcus sp. HUN007]|uniref:AMP-binding protein n=1 Tax=Ruminococcus sp. HUN007 TaxID=1514668 RepID=UPI0005D27D01|nr:AMP-binding protein [Ruminococcus sp. HUN007]